MVDEKELLEEVELEVAEMTPEQLEDEARKLLEQQEKRREYNRNRTKSPEQVEKQRQARKKRYQRQKLILAKAKEEGLIPEAE